MKKKIQTLFMGIIIGIVLFASFQNILPVYSNDTNMTLVAGKSYEITNKNNSNYLFINIKGSSAIDYVSYNKDKSVSSFGTTSSSLFLSAGGTTTVTINETDAEILYSTDNTGIKEISGEVLKRIKITSGSSLIVTNKNFDKRYALSSETSSVGVKYDAVFKNNAGDVINYFSKSTGTIEVTEGGKMIITASAESDLSLYAPAKWFSQDLVTEISLSPALSYYTISKGKTALITNANSDLNYKLTMKSSSDFAGATYDFVNKDINGNVIEYGNTGVYKNITLRSGGNSIITACDVDDLLIYMPTEWKTNNIIIKEETQSALKYYTLTSGKTVEIKNSDYELSHSIKVDSTTSDGNPKFDYVYKNSNDMITGYGSLDSISDIKIEQGGKAVIQAQKGHNIKFLMPSEWTSVTYTETAQPALYFYNLKANKSISLKNLNSDREYEIKVDAGDSNITPKFDVVQNDGANYVSDYFSGTTNSIVIRESGSVDLSISNGINAKLFIPYDWYLNEVKISELSSPVLTYHTIKSASSMLFVNSNPDTDYTIKTAEISPESPAAKFDYVSKDMFGRIVSYDAGVSDKEIDVLSDGKTLVTSGNASTLEVYYPSAWDSKDITASTSQDKAIQFHTINVSKTFNIVNQSNDYDFTIKANKDGFKYEVVNTDDRGFLIECGVNNLDNDFNLSTGGTLKITAKSYPINLFYPTEWTNKYIKISESSTNAVYTYNLNSSESVIISGASGKSQLNIFTDSQTLEYVVKDSDGQVAECMPQGIYNNIRVNENGSVIITAGKGYGSKLYFPSSLINDGTLTMQNSGTPAVYYQTVKPGQSINLSNKNTTQSFGVKLDFAYGSGKFDYTQKDTNGKVINYGSDASFNNLLVAMGGSSQITVKGTNEVNLYMPYEWTVSDLALNTGAKETINSYILKAGTTIDIENLNTSSNCTLNIKCGDGMITPKFDYVSHNKVEVIGYNRDEASGSLTIISGGKVRITAAEGYDLELLFPADWSVGRLKITPVSTPALTVYTVAANNSMTISNSSNKALDLKTNNYSKFFIDQATSGNAYEYSTREVSGNISVPGRSGIRIRVVAGYDLEMYVPSEWTVLKFN